MRLTGQVEPAGNSKDVPACEDGKHWEPWQLLRPELHSPQFELVEVSVGLLDGEKWLSAKRSKPRRYFQSKGTGK